MRALIPVFSAVLVLLFLFSCNNTGKNPGNVEDSFTDSLAYEFDTISRTLSCNDEREEPCLDVQIIMLQVKGDAPEEVIEEINAQLERSAANADNSEAPALKPEALADNLVKEYQRILQEMPDYKMPWEMSQMYEVVLNENGLFGVMLSSYSFTGGAHGNYFYLHQLYEINSGKRLKITDLVKEEAMVQLRKMAERQFYEINNIGDSTSLSDAGYWFEENTFALPDNFSYSHQGLEFIYNTYEVASFSEGVIRIRFDLEEVNALIKPQYRLLEAETPAAEA
mgnify:CR=1 FL=1